MHKGFDISQLRASEEWYVFIGHEYITIAVDLGVKQFIKQTMKVTSIWCKIEKEDQ